MVSSVHWCSGWVWLLLYRIRYSTISPLGSVGGHQCSRTVDGVRGLRRRSDGGVEGPERRGGGGDRRGHREFCWGAAGRRGGGPGLPSSSSHTAHTRSDSGKSCCGGAELHPRPPSQTLSSLLSSAAPQQRPQGGRARGTHGPAGWSAPPPSRRARPCPRRGTAPRTRTW